MSAKNTDSRVLGIDILKIVSMFFIIIGHLLCQYGIENGMTSLSSQHTVNFLGVISSSAVNCYALCTGYLMIHKRAKLSRLIYLWFQVFFYSIGITALFFLLMRNHIIPEKNGIDGSLLVTSLFPIIKNSWWYASCYFGLYLLIPIINNLILNSGKQKVLMFLVISFCLSSVSALIYGDGLCIKFGYSVAWLIILYVCGAFIRLYDIKGNKPLLKWGGVVILTWLLAMLLDVAFVHKMTGEAKSSHILALYTSPFTIYASLQLFLFFLSIKTVRSSLINSIIKRVALATFGIYLIHTHDVVWEYFADYIIVDNSTIMILIVTICVSLCIFIICFIIDVLRQYLFSIMNLKDFSEKISFGAGQLYTKCIQKLF